jgi:hypothetical protein
MALLSLSAGLTGWLRDFLRDSKSKIRTNIDIAGIELVLEKIEEADKHKLDEKDFGSGVLSFVAAVGHLTRKRKLPPLEALIAHWTAIYTLHAYFEGQCPQQDVVTCFDTFSKFVHSLINSDYGEKREFEWPEIPQTIRDAKMEL